MAHEQAVSGVGGGRWIVAADVVEGAVSLVAAIDDVVEDPAVTVREVDGLEDVDVDRILDHAPLIARREVDVRDEGIAAVRWIDLGIGAGKDLLVLADASERQAAERRRLDAHDLERGDVRLGGQAERAQENCANR